MQTHHCWHQIKSFFRIVQTVKINFVTFNANRFVDNVTALIDTALSFFKNILVKMLLKTKLNNKLTFARMNKNFAKIKKHYLSNCMASRHDQMTESALCHHFHVSFTILSIRLIESQFGRQSRPDLESLVSALHEQLLVQNSPKPLHFLFVGN